MSALTFNHTEGVAEESVKTLVSHLETEIPSLESVFSEWPAGNITIKLPSVSAMSTGNVGHRTLAHKPIVLLGDFNATTKKRFVLREVGYWDFEIQLDLWARHKNQRTELLEKLDDVLNPDLASTKQSGLHLRMPEYFNSIASYTYLGYRYEDGEISAQTRMWRALLKLQVNTRSLRAKEEFAMENITIDFDTRDTAEELDPS